MNKDVVLVPSERIEQAILLIRGQRVMLDADLAVLYGVPTRVLNQAVKRNSKRFPEDFMFKLTQAEKGEVITNCDHLKNLKYAKTPSHRVSTRRTGRRKVRKSFPFPKLPRRAVARPQRVSLQPRS